MSARMSPMRLLVVEDDDALRETLGLVLAALGHDARLSSNEEGAILALAQEWPDLLLLDLTLERITGEELYLKILQRFGRVPPTIVLSAVPHGEERIRVRMPGVGFVPKPYSIEQLQAAIEAFFPPARIAA